MLTARYLIAFTGHRSGFDESAVRTALETALGELQALAVQVDGEAALYASVAEGVDTLCVEVARRLDLAVHLLLPLPPDEFEKDFSSPQAWERAREQIELAGKKPGRNTVHVLPGEMRRPDCYFDQGIRILEAADVLVAVWDGQPAKGLGGSEQVVTHARRTGKPVLVIDPATGEFRVEGDLESAFASDEICENLAATARTAETGCADQPATADQLQQCLDGVAVVEAGRFRPSVILIILLHGIAALLAALVTFQLTKESAWEHWKWSFTATELLLVSYALWLSLRLHRRHTQERWIRCRFACELVRSLRASVPLIDPLSPSIVIHDPRGGASR